MCNMTDTDGYIHYSGAEIGKWFYHGSNGMKRVETF
jgi:hypothetical protein